MYYIELDNDKPFLKINEHTNWVKTLYLFEDNKQNKILASGSFDKTIKLWDMKTYKCIETLDDHDDWVYTFTSFKNSLDKFILASGGWDKIIKLYDISKKYTKIADLKDHEGPIFYLTNFVIEKELFLASGSWDSIAILWSTQNDKCTIFGKIKGQENGISCCLIFTHKVYNDFPNFVSGGWDNNILIFDLKEMKEDKGEKGEREFKTLRRLKGHQNPVRCLIRIMFFGEERFASSSDDGHVIIWDFHNDYIILQEFILHKYPISCLLAFEDKNNRFILITSCNDKRIAFWDITKHIEKENEWEATKIVSLIGHTEAVNSILLSNDLPNCKNKFTLISSSGDNSIMFWNLGE